MKYDMEKVHGDDTYERGKGTAKEQKFAADDARLLK